MSNNYILTSDGELYHWGIKGMKWGVRRYQNEDGTLTEAGKKRLVKRVQRADANNNPSYARTLAEEAFDNYRSTSKSYQTAKTSKKKLDELKREISDQADRYAEGKIGKSYKDISKEIKTYEIKQQHGWTVPGDDEWRNWVANKYMQRAYLDLGAKEATRIFSTDKTFRNAAIKHDENYKVAYKEAARYVKDALGKWGDAPMPGKNSIAVDLQTGKARQQTASERIGVEVVRDIRDDSIRR